MGSEELLHGAKLATVLIARLAERGIGENVLALQMPGWASRTPAKPIALAYVRGSMLHLLAAVDTWAVISAPPASLAERFARVWSWNRGGPDVELISNSLAELALAWNATAIHEVGLLDVLGGLTHAAGARLGVERGEFGNVVSAEHRANSAAQPMRGALGRERAGPRWPMLVDLRATERGVEARLARAQSIVIATVSEGLQQLGPMIDRLRERDDACAAATDRLRALEREAEQLGASIATPVPGASWRLTSPFDLDVDAELVVWISTAAPIGGEVDVRIFASGARGLRVACGDAPAIEVEALADLRVEELAAAVERESRVLRPHRLVPGARYRVRQTISSAAGAGTVLIFERVTEVKPSGADHWFFSVEGQDARVDLAAGDAELDALDAYLEPA